MDYYWSGHSRILAAKGALNGKYVLARRVLSEQHRNFQQLGIHCSLDQRAE